MIFDTVSIELDGTKAVLALPASANSYYKASRFDHSGIILELTRGSHSYVEKWFDTIDPLCHDCVCGPADVIYPVGYDSAPVGGEFFVIGVGVLKKDADEPYAETKLYEITDPGVWMVESDSGSVTFRQVVDHGDIGWNYTKKVELLPGGVFTISHHLVNRSLVPVSCLSYNHNFFIFDSQLPSVATQVRFPYKPVGEWRTLPTDSDCARLTEDGVVFDRDLEKDRKVCIWELLSADGVQPYDFTVTNSRAGAGVKVHCDAPLHHIQFWSNSRVTCVEPKIELNVPNGGEYDWTITYRLL